MVTPPRSPSPPRDTADPLEAQLSELQAAYLQLQREIVQLSIRLGTLPCTRKNLEERDELTLNIGKARESLQILEGTLALMAPPKRLESTIRGNSASGDHPLA